MAYYNSPAEMYTARADRFKRDGDRHWAMAQNGHSAHHYGKAKFCYEQASINNARAQQAHASNAVFRKGSTLK